MLPDEHAHRLVKEFHFVDVGSPRTLAFVMDDLRRRSIVNLPARLLDTITPIEVLAIHEKLFIQAPYTLQYFPPEYHKRAADRIDFIRLVGIEIFHVVFAEPFGMWEKGAQSGNFRKRNPGSWEAAPACKLERAIGVEDLATRQPRFGMLFHELHHRVQRVFLDNRIEAYEQNVPSRRFAQSGIIRRRKTDIGVVGDQLH